MEPVVRRITDAADLDRMTRWMHEWWGREEGFPVEAVRACMTRSLQTARLPQTFGLYLQDELIGMYQFTMSDLFVRPDVYPWLANVYIVPEYRGAGYGRILLGSVRENAAALGLPELFLFTAHEGLYERYGWEFVGMTDTHLSPRQQRLYRLPLTAD